MKKIKVVTHNGRFHADDVFAAATLRLVFGNSISIKRTRNESEIKNAEIVFDVGRKYEPENNKFDHHQKGGAGKRKNGIPYAAFGLVWKKYGEKICDSKKVAEQIDQEIVQPTDSMDNGVSIYKTVFPGVHPYIIASLISAFIPTWKETKNTNIDNEFKKVVDLAEKILRREIKKAKDNLEAQKIILSYYNKAKDKKIVVLPETPRFEDENIISALIKFKDVLFFVKPADDEMGRWKAKSMRKDFFSYENRALFPKKWRGLSDKDLSKSSKITGAVFCHNAGFLFVADSRQGAITGAEKAVSAHKNK